MFSRFTKIAIEIDPQEFNCIPPNFIISGTNARKFRACQKLNLNATFIAKPDEVSGGDLISLFTSISDLSNQLQNSTMTVKRYIAKPLLVNGF